MKTPVPAGIDDASAPPALETTWRVEEALPQLAERARRLACRGERKLLGITGPPGAGKSTLAAGLKDALGEVAVVVGLDGFHLAQRELCRLGRADRKGAPDTFDAAGYATLLERLRGNRDAIVYAPLFNRAVEEPIAGSIAVPKEVPLVITEGNYLLLESGVWPSARSQLHAVWYLDLPEDQRQERLIRRHRLYGKSLRLARIWALERDQENARLVERSRARADLVVRLLNTT